MQLENKNKLKQSSNIRKTGHIGSGKNFSTLFLIDVSDKLNWKFVRLTFQVSYDPESVSQQRVVF